jgi:hypothetical protein
MISKGYCKFPLSKYQIHHIPNLVIYTSNQQGSVNAPIANNLLDSDGIVDGGII